MCSETKLRLPKEISGDFSNELERGS